MKKVLAISGGVDSVVLMHIFRDDPEAIVAHFDHGTRASSTDDAEFVAAAAKYYNLPFYSSRAKLGSNVSEEQARISRYEYFSCLCREVDGEVWTAHHADDLIESIAINLTRGTSWRGLVPFGNTAIKRPFIETTLLPKGSRDEFSKLQGCFSDDGVPGDESDFVVDKKMILQYATEHGLSFRQDPTNTEDKYLRNRLREKMRFLDDSKKKELLKIYHQTNNLKNSVDQLLDEILPKDGVYQRTWFDDLDRDEAIEILRAALMRAGVSATRPQMLDFLKAIREYEPAKQFNLPGDRLVKISKNFFILK